MKSGEQGGDPQAHLAGSCCAPPPPLLVQESQWHLGLQ